jgi:hypothetical protein
MKISITVNLFGLIESFLDLDKYFDLENVEFTLAATVEVFEDDYTYDEIFNFDALLLNSAEVNLTTAQQNEIVDYFAEELRLELDEQRSEHQQLNYIEQY